MVPAAEGEPLLDQCPSAMGNQSHGTLNRPQCAMERVLLLRLSGEPGGESGRREVETSQTCGHARPLPAVRGLTG